MLRTEHSKLLSQAWDLVGGKGIDRCQTTDTGCPHTIRASQAHEGLLWLHSSSGVGCENGVGRKKKTCKLYFFFFFGLHCISSLIETWRHEITSENIPTTIPRVIIDCHKCNNSNFRITKKLNLIWKLISKSATSLKGFVSICMTYFWVPFTGATQTTRFAFFKSSILSGINDKSTLDHRCLHNCSKWLGQTELHLGE